MSVLSFEEIHPLSSGQGRRPSSEGQQPASEWGRRRRSSDHGRRLSSFTPLTLQYPAYVLPLEVFLSLDRWVPHQELLARGLLVKAVPGTTPDFIFVSHQWRGTDHPDSDGQQLRVLQSALYGLLEGQCKVRQDFATRVSLFATSRSINDRSGARLARRWQNGLTQGLIWIDYFSVPQPSTVQDPIERSRTLHLMWLAVKSIVSYVSMASCFIILAPPLLRTDRPTEPINYGSWQRRGWCLMERTSWVLSKQLHSEGMLLVEDEAIVTLEKAERVLSTTLGTAEWTDPADLEELAPILHKLLDRKRRQCLSLDDIAGLHSLMVAEGRYLQGILHVALDATVSDTICRHASTSRSQTDDDESPRESSEQMQSTLVCSFLAECSFPWVSSRDKLGRTALHMAAAIGDPALIAALLAARANPLVKTTRVDPGSGMPVGSMPIHFASAWCVRSREDSAEVLQLLLDAKMTVNPPAGFFTSAPLHVAARWNNVTMASLLLRLQADMESLDIFGVSALGVAVVHSANEVLRLLLHQHARLDQGGVKNAPAFSVSHLAACSSSVAATLPALIAARADLNAKSTNSTGLTSKALKLLLTTVKLCGVIPRLVFFFRALVQDDVSPLMLATIINNVQAVQALVIHKADPSLRSRRGHTALDFASMADNHDNSTAPAIRRLLWEGRRLAFLSLLPGTRSASGLEGSHRPPSFERMEPSPRSWLVRL